MEQFKLRDANHPLLTMPLVNGHQYIIEWLFDVGPTMMSSMGNSPLTFEEIYAWGKDIDISHWEASTIRKLSIDYLSMLHHGSEPDCPVPYAETPSEDKLQQVSNGLKAVFLAMANKDKK